MLSRLVGCWQGTLLHRTEADRPFQQLPGTSENRWVLGGRFVEMTLRAGTSGDTWSAVFYIGYERSERRHVLVSLEPGDRRITTRLGDWTLEQDRLVLTSHQSRAVCDMTIPGQLTLELAEEPAPARNSCGSKRISNGGGAGDREAGAAARASAIRDCVGRAKALRYPPPR